MYSAQTETDRSTETHSKIQRNNYNSYSYENVKLVIVYLFNYIEKTAYNHPMLYKLTLKNSKN